MDTKYIATKTITRINDLFEQRWVFTMRDKSYALDLLAYGLYSRESPKVLEFFHVYRQDTTADKNLLLSEVPIPEDVVAEAKESLVSRLKYSDIDLPEEAKKPAIEDFLSKISINVTTRQSEGGWHQATQPEPPAEGGEAPQAVPIWQRDGFSSQEEWREAAAFDALCRDEWLTESPPVEGGWHQAAQPEPPAESEEVDEDVAVPQTEGEEVAQDAPPLWRREGFRNYEEWLMAVVSPMYEARRQLPVHYGEEVAQDAPLESPPVEGGWHQAAQPEPPAEGEEVAEDAPPAWQREGFRSHDGWGAAWREAALGRALNPPQHGWSWRGWRQSRWRETFTPPSPENRLD